MKAYSNDLRERIIAAIAEGESYRRIAKRFRVSVGFVHKLAKLYRETGKLDPRLRGGKGVSQRKLTDQVLQQLSELIKQHPDATLEELRTLMAAEYQVVLSQTTLRKGLALLRISRKKKTYRAAEQDKDKIQEERQAYWEEVRQLDPARLVFVDETGSNLGMAPEYGRAPIGERVYDSKPVNYGENITILGALHLSGQLTAMTVEGSTDGAVFNTYIKQVLAPSLKPGDVVIMDNLRAHKVSGVAEAIKAAGARLIYLARYSPEFSPIEHCWSKLKAYLKKKCARTKAVLEQALAEAITSITTSDALGWFQHCGYQIQPAA